MKIELIENLQYPCTLNSLISSRSYHISQNYQQYYDVSYSEEFGVRDNIISSLCQLKQIRIWSAFELYPLFFL